MFKQSRFLMLLVMAVASLSQSHASLVYGQYSDNSLSDNGDIASFGAGYKYYPGRVFGFDRRYLATRAISAYGGFGTLSHGTPQPPPPVPRRTAVLARSAEKSTGSATTASAAAGGDRIVNGEAAFRDGDYSGAIDNWWKELAVGAPNPVLQMMLGQAYFADGKYQEATVATQAAMRALPEDRWGFVITNRKELYNDPQDYNVQLRELESAVHDKPRDPAFRFLLGYHYAYLGYPEAAVAQLDQAVKLDPRNEAAVQLRGALLQQITNPGGPVITPGVATPERQPPLPSSSSVHRS